MAFSKELLALLELPESDTLDFKEKKPKELADTVMAFANLRGGTILLGVKEVERENGTQKGEAVGLNMKEDGARLSISSSITTITPVVNYNIEREEDNGTAVYLISIDEGQNKPYGKSGTFKIRNGNSNKPLSPDELKGMFLQSSKKEFENNFKTATATIKDDLTDLWNLSQELIAQVQMLGSEIDRIDDLKEKIDLFQTNFEIRLDENEGNQQSLIGLLEDILGEVEQTDSVIEKLDDLIHNRSLDYQYITTKIESIISHFRVRDKTFLLQLQEELRRFNYDDWPNEAQARILFRRYPSLGKFIPLDAWISYVVLPEERGRYRSIFSLIRKKGRKSGIKKLR